MSENKNRLYAGFSRVNITPAMGTPLGGYYKVRLADGVTDELEANALALSHGETRVLLISVDHLGLKQVYQDPIRRFIAERTGVPEDSIFIACTHTHTAPKLEGEIVPNAQETYFQFLKSRLADAAAFALADLKPARMGWAVGQAPGIAFIRRFLMKDGTVCTNPRPENPDIVGPVGQVDESVSLLRFVREEGPEILLVHFGCHPDTVGGNRVSADWPGFTRRILERSLDNVRCVFFNGVQGDINHLNPFHGPGYLNGLTMDFDDVLRGYEHTEHMGRTVAGAVMQVYAKVNYVEVDSIRAMQRVIRHPSNRPLPEELPQARLYNQLHQEHRDSEIPYEGMMLTTVVAEAERMLELEHGPDDFALRVSAVSVGDIALVGAPGEPFSDIRRDLKEAPGWPLVLPCCCTNGYEGYFPPMNAYENGSYETRSSIFRSGVAEAISGAGLELLETMKQ